MDDSVIQAGVDSFLAGEKANKEAALRNNFVNSSGTSPDDFAKQIALSKATNIPIQSLMADPVEAAKHRALVNTDFSGLVASSPLTADFLLDPKNAGIARDDTDSLSVMEQTGNFLKSFIGGFGAAVHGINTGGWGMARAASENFVEPISGAFGSGFGTSLTAYIQRLRKASEADYATTQNFGGDLSEMGVVKRGFFNAVSSAVQSTLTLPAALEFKMAEGGLALSSAIRAIAPLGAVQGGLAYTEARDKGVGKGTSLAYAGAQAATEVWTELLPMGRLIKDLGVGAPLWKTLRNQLVTENVGEQFATHFQDLNTWLTVNPEKTLKDYLNERPNAALETLIATTFATGMQTTAAHLAVRSMQQSNTLNRAAENGATQTEEMFAAAARSLVGQRSPETLKAFLEHLAPDATVLVDSTKLSEVLAQTGVDIGVLPTAQAQLENPEFVGAGVEIPYSELITGLVGTEAEKAIIPHLRFDANMPTLAEAQEYDTQAAAFFQQEADRILTEESKNQEFMDGAQAVQDDLFNQLSAVGRNGPQVNNGYAKLGTAFYSVLAKEFGVTPLQIRDGWTDAAGVVHRGYGLKIGGEPNTAAGLSQLSQQTETPEFKNWFGDSKVVDESGKPLVVYHGTGADFSAFDPDTSGQSSKTGAPSGTFFFTDSTDVASSYTVGWQGDFSQKLKDTANVMPVRLSIKRPLKLNAKGENWREILYKGEYRDINEIAQLAKDSGKYDGMIVTRVKDSGVGRTSGKPSTTYVAFEPTQIKSAIGNRGTFDPNDPNILHQTFQTVTPKQTDAYRADVAWTDTGEENGFPTWKSAHVELANPRDVTEGHDIFYLPKEDARAVKYDIKTPDGRTVGQTVLEVSDGWPTMLLDIETNPGERGNRYAEYTVAAIANDVGELAVWHIVPEARSWWERQGTAPVDEFNGALTFNDYADARASRENPRGVGGQVAFNQPAYHGSPYKFDKFSLEHMGKGEGAQAFGWGLYFAGNKEVAEYYKNTLSVKKVDIRVNGRRVPGTVIAQHGDTVARSLGRAPTKAEVAAHMAERVAAIDSLPAIGFQPSYLDLAAKKELQLAIKTLEKAKKFEVEFDSADGQLYAVDIPGDDTMLHWDKPLSEQPEAVRAALEPLMQPEVDRRNAERARMNTASPGRLTHPVIGKIANRVVTVADIRGQAAYEAISSAQGSDEAASKYLNSLGISGIKYLDGSSRDKGEGAYNYVVFDDNAVQLLDTFYQTESAPLGSFSPETLDLNLLAGANYTTFVHELGHFFLTAYADIAAQEGAPKKIVDDMNAILGQFGIKGDETVGGPDAGGALNQSALDPDEVKTNPSVSRLVAMLRRSKGKSLRYVVDANGSFHFWDAFLAVHQDGAEAAGVPYDYTRRGTVSLTSDGLARFDYADLGISTAELRRYMVGESTAFHAPGYGEVTGREMAEILDAESDTLLRDLLAQGRPVDAPSGARDLPTRRTPLETWRAMTLEQQRQYHEQIAESFEQYVFTGKAPSLELQPLFSTMLSWFKRVYQSLKDFVATHSGAKLNPELSAVFDRMLATDAEIASANEARGYVALFKDAAEAGMSDKDFAAYTALADAQREDAESMLRTRSLRDMKWLQARRNKIIAELQKDAAEKRADMRKTVAAEVRAEPIRQAERYLKHGVILNDVGSDVAPLGPNKLQISEVRDLYPAEALTPAPDWTKLGYGKYGMLAEVGLSPAEVAERFGLPSGPDLVETLLAQQPLNAEIESRTDQRMLEAYGDITAPDVLARAADEAIHNDFRTRAVATELSALAANIGAPSVLMKAAKEYARQVLETKTSKTIRPWSYAAAETRAGKAAMAALKKGDRETAAIEKRTELVNHVTAKEAYAVEKEIKKIVDRFKKLAAYNNESSAVKSRDFATVQAIRSLLADHGIGSKGDAAQDYLETVKEHDPIAAQRLQDILAVTGENPKDWADIKLADLREFSVAIDDLWFAAARTRQMEVQGKLVAQQDVADELLATLVEQGIPTRVPGEGWAPTKTEKLGMKFGAAKAVLRRMEFVANVLDGNRTVGPWLKNIVGVIQDATAAMNVAKGETLKTFESLLDTIRPSLKRGEIAAPELGYIFGKGPSGSGRAELLHAILHTGNESNMRKMLLGREWAVELPNGALDTTKWDSFVARMKTAGYLTKADYDFAQGVWNLMDSLKPAAQKAHRAVFGKFFSEVTAKPFTNEFGTYAGGYVPALTDSDIVKDNELRNLREDAFQGMEFSFPAPMKGFTNARVEGYTRALKLDLGSLNSHISQVLLFSHLAVPVSDVQRVLARPEISGAINRLYPSMLKATIIPWLNRVAKNTTSSTSADFVGLGRFLRTARSNAGVNTMMGSLSNSIQQLVGILPASVAIDGKYLRRAVVYNLTSPGETAEYVKSLSPYMQTRMDNEAYAALDNIDQILTNPNVYESTVAWTRRHAYFMQSAVDNFLSPTIWIAAYNQALEKDVSKADAVHIADSLIRQTQGASGAADIATFEAGHPFMQLFTQFTGYFNMMAQFLHGQMVKNMAADVGLPKKYARAFYIVGIGFFAQAVAAELVSMLFRGGPEDDDKDGSTIDEWLVQLGVMAPLKFMTATVPFLGTALQVSINKWNNKSYDDKMMNSPAISTLEQGLGAPVAAYKAVFEEGKPSTAIRGFAGIIGLFTGLPTALVARPVGYLADVAAGKVEPTSTPDMVRGIITGTASPDSKQ